MSSVEWFLWVGSVVTVAGAVRLVLATDVLIRLVALNIAAGGSLLVIVGLAARGPQPDPVLHALALTGIVITVAFTGVGLALARRLDTDGSKGAAPAPAGPAPPASGAGGAR